jgi:hypothetical protein
VDEDTQSLGEPLEADLLLAATLGELVNAAMSEVHAFFSGLAGSRMGISLTVRV